MKEQVVKSTEALETALQMEIEGKEYYNKAEQISESPLAKQLFYRLAKAEDVHMQKINEIYEVIKNSAKWPEKETTFIHGKSLRSVFKEAIDNINTEMNASASEIEALKTAMKMEDDSYSFYHSRAEESASSAEKSFYQALTAEERDHYLTLLDSYEFLTDPQGWFAKTEHWGLDAG